MIRHLTITMAALMIMGLAGCRYYKDANAKYVKEHNCRFLYKEAPWKEVMDGEIKVNKGYEIWQCEGVESHVYVSS